MHPIGREFLPFPRSAAQIGGYHWGQNYYIPFFRLGEFFRSCLIEPNFEALSWFFLKEKPQNSYEPGGLVNSLVSGTLKFNKSPFLDMDVVKTLSILVG